MKLLIDQYHLHETKRGDFVVNDEASFQQARRLIFDFSVKGLSEVESIHVYQPPFTNWFDDVPGLVERLTPRTLLAAKHPGVELPNELSDEAIHSLGLIGNSIIPSEREIFRHFFGSELPQDGISVKVLYQLAQIRASRGEQLTNTYLNSLWRFTLLSLQNSDMPILNALTAPLLEVDAEYAAVICEGIYCARNKMYFEHWQHDHARYLNEFNINGSQLRELLQREQDWERPLNNRLEKSIYHFVVEHYQNGAINFPIISGAYPSEADALIHLKPNLSLEDYQLLSERFAGSLSYLQQQDLRRLCRPVSMPLPDLNGYPLTEQHQIWKNWAVESFIPFKFYYDEVSEVDPDVLMQIHEGSTAYSDWLFSNYRAILSNTDILTNLDIVTQIRGLLNEPQIRVIWLILDGFPAFYAPALRGILKKFGINKVELDWSLATLPTITELGIPTMLAGAYERRIEPKDLGNRQQLLSKALNGKRCNYTSKLKEFRTLLEIESDLCCLHTHEIDVLLHKEDAEFDTPRAVQIEQILEKRLKMISEVIRESTEKRIKLVISTDHGATKCLNKGQKIKNIRLTEAIKDRTRERCVPLQGSLAHEQVDHQEMYVLDADSAQNQVSWAIARGYTYFGKYDSGYRHGGLSPEETIVPLLVCEVSASAQAQLQLRYIGAKELTFGKTEKDFRIKIKNNGQTAIEITAFSVKEDENCIFDLPFQIPAQADRVLTAAIKLPLKLQAKARGGRLELRFNLECLIMGERDTQQLQCVVATAKDEFEDDFDF